MASYFVYTLPFNQLGGFAGSGLIFEFVMLGHCRGVVGLEPASFGRLLARPILGQIVPNALYSFACKEVSSWMRPQEKILIVGK